MLVSRSCGVWRVIRRGWATDKPIAQKHPQRRQQPRRRDLVLVGERHLQGCRCYDGAAHRPDRFAFGQPSPCGNDDRRGYQLAGERQHAFEVVADSARLAGAIVGISHRQILAPSPSKRAVCLDFDLDEMIRVDQCRHLDHCRDRSDVGEHLTVCLADSFPVGDVDAQRSSSERPDRRLRRPWRGLHR